MLIEGAVNGTIPSPFSIGNCCISHLLFADDLFIFSRATQSAGDHIRAILQAFKVNSGLMVNNAKSSVLLSNCD